ncbi:MAG: DNA polymerase [Bacteroidales bacterium]|nr:DNA polymerase [Bacteroidales bacterium]
MKTLAIDIETYSDIDLLSCGVYRYAESDAFRVLLFAYSEDGGDVEVVDLARGEELPAHVAAALTDPGVTKTAFNAAFERVCLSRHLGIEGFLDPSQWDCTMVAAARMGLPLSLAQCGEVLGLDDKGEGKMKEGRALIKKFSCPNRKGGRTLPEDHPEDWETFRRYCKRDVEVEQAIRRRVARLQQPEWERELYALDQRINDRGVLVDEDFVRNADKLNREYLDYVLDEARRLTGLENPNSDAQMKRFILDHAGVQAASLNKKSIDDIEGSVGRHSVAYKALQLRKEFKKTSCKKYPAMLDCACRDGRIRGLLQYYGAARTGRWAGRLVQIHNLPQNHIKRIDDARTMAKAGDLDEFMTCYSNPTQVLSELIRTSFVAGEGKTFRVCDFSAIEARVTAWLSGEEWVLDVFRNEGDIYCETASKMFGVPVEKHGRNAELRQKGKIAALALGYGGGTAALDAMGGGKMGLSQPEMQGIVRMWRGANGHTVRLWEVLEKAARKAITENTQVTVNRGVTFRREFGCLTVQLPSGRRLCYPRAKVGPFTKRFGGEAREVDAIIYEGVNQTTKKWCEVETYGGKLTENIVQAMARDILGEIMFRADRKGMEIAFHVHDEIIVEADGRTTLEDVEAIFAYPPAWAEGLPLKGAGYSTPYYLKD